MRRLVLLFFAVGSLFADFISTYEYGEQLYQSPRGITCAACHGEDGSGKQVAGITVPDIKNVSRERLGFALTRGRSIMPIISFDRRSRSLTNHFRSSESTRLTTP